MQVRRGAGLWLGASRANMCARRRMRKIEEQLGPAGRFLVKMGQLGRNYMWHGEWQRLKNSWSRGRSSKK